MKRRSSVKFSGEQWAAGAVGALVLFAMLYVFVTKLAEPLVIYGFHHGPLLFYGLLEGIMILISVLAGAGFALAADIFIRRETYKPYLACTIILTAVILAFGYWLLVHSVSTELFFNLERVFPNFFNTGFLLPGIAAHFAALHCLLKRKTV